MEDKLPKLPGGVLVKPQELIDIIRAAAGAGVASLKMGDIEVQFGVQRKQVPTFSNNSSRPSQGPSGADWYNQEPPVSALDD